MPDPAPPDAYSDEAGWDGARLLRDAGASAARLTEALTAHAREMARPGAPPEWAAGQAALDRAAAAARRLVAAIESASQL